MKYLCFLIGLSFLSACSYNRPEISETSDRFESETFTRFYVIGDGYSAGFMNGTLTSEGQGYSYPNVIGNKIDDYFETDIFRQADVQTNLGLNRFEDGILGQYELFYRSPGDEVLARRVLEGEIPSPLDGDAFTLRDFSLPGIRSYEFDNPSQSVENLYLNRLSLAGQSSLLDLVIEQNPSVVLISVGYDDLLPYVMSSATGETDLPVEEISSVDGTPIAIFSTSIRGLVDRLRDESDASIIILTLPDPLLSPYFSTIKYSMDLGTEITAPEIGQLNSFYRDFNDRAFEYNLSDTISEENLRPFIDFDVDGGAQFKARVILDPTLPDVVFDDGYELPKIRQIREDEYLPFRLEQTLFENNQYGKTQPIQPEDVITKADKSNIRRLLDGYNAEIRALSASSDEIHLLDVEEMISELNEGEIQIDGVFYNAGFARESLFSSDGLFLNPKGNALIARRLTELLNREFDVSLTPVDVNSYPGIKFSQDF
jgi:hypothetical protein